MKLKEADIGIECMFVQDVTQMNKHVYTYY